MTRYSVQPRDRIFVKADGFLSFTENMGKNIGKNISKSLNSKYNQKLLDHAKQSATDTFKTSSKGVIQRTAWATSDLTGNKIADKIIRVSKLSPKNNSERIKEAKTINDLTLLIIIIIIAIIIITITITIAII